MGRNKSSAAGAIFEISTLTRLPAGDQAVEYSQTENRFYFFFDENGLNSSKFIELGEKSEILDRAPQWLIFKSNTGC